MRKILRNLGNTICILILFCISSVPARAENEALKLMPEIQVEEAELLTGMGLSELAEILINGEEPDYKSIADRFLKIFFEDIRSSLSSVILIFAMAMLSACIRGTAVNMSSENSDVAFLIMYCVIAALLLGILKTSYEIASEAARKIIAFVKLSVPAYIGIASAVMPRGIGNLNGIFVLMVNVVAEFAGGFVLKILFFVGIMYIVNNISTEIHILKLIELVRQSVFWILGFLLTVFSGLTGLSGISVSAVSKSGIGAAKYALGHSLPLVGGFLADSAELIYSSAVVLKGVMGVVGIAALFAICLFPAAKLFSIGIILKAVAALAEPFCDKRICSCISAVGQTVIYIMVCVILVCVMFIFNIAVIIIAGGG